jgi:hypothetical protein
VIEGQGAGTPLPIAEIVRRARSARPDFTPTHVNFASYGSAGSTVRVQGDLPGYRLVQRGQTMLVFDADSGRILQTVDRTQQGLGRRLLAMVRPLHYGYFWPGIAEALYFLLGAAATILVASGLLIWAERDKRARHPRAGSITTVMERANVGVMGGCMLALAAMAVIAAAARIPALAPLAGMVGGFHFSGGQDFLGKKPIALELWLFLAAWLALGTAVAFARPATGWRLSLIASAIGLALLPLLAAATTTSPVAFALRADGEGLFYAAVCVLLAASLLLIARRVGRAPA